ncbi:MAG TPA: hypothetical protein VJA46_06860 [Acidimicrobiia bacterium]|nr:hypothetical protein [Acidimicrobiia bacterium]
MTLIDTATGEIVEPTLAECEAIIERGLETFVEVGQALLIIRDNRLYRETHKTFESYCDERWDMSRVHAHRLIGASEVIRVLPIGNTPQAPSNEAQARALAPLKGAPDLMAEAWAEAVSESDGKPTAKVVSEAVAKRRQMSRKADEVAEQFAASTFGLTDGIAEMRRLGVIAERIGDLWRRGSSKWTPEEQSVFRSQWGETLNQLTVVTELIGTDMDAELSRLLEDLS